MVCMIVELSSFIKCTIVFLLGVKMNKMLQVVVHTQQMATNKDQQIVNSNDRMSLKSRDLSFLHID